MRSARLTVITGLPGSGKTTLATELANQSGAVRLCPDDWMMAAGIDLWDDTARAKIETAQLDLARHLLSVGTSVIIEWGTWTRAERDALRVEAAACGAAFELLHTDASVDDLWRRIVERDAEGRWGARPIERRELDEWVDRFEPPTPDEFES